MGVFSKSIKTFDDLFVHTLQDMYYAEQAIVAALPGMAKKAATPALRQAFATHLRESETQITRLERVFALHGAETKPVTCQAVDGIIDETDHLMSEIEDPVVLDAAMLSAAQAIEHYEICRYGTLVAFARRLGYEDCARILEETLAEEKATDRKLTDLAERGINSRAAAE